jgi:MYXO-CTERM domain-containing protein
MRLRPRLLTALALAPLAGLACDPPERSDEGDYALRVSLPDRLGVDSRRVLVGSDFDLDLVGLVVDGELRSYDEGELACVPQSASGVLSFDGQRYVVESAGVGAVEFEAPGPGCPESSDAAELGPDRWTVRGVAADSVQARWLPTDDKLPPTWDLLPGPAGAFPDTLGRPLEQARVIDGGHFSLTPVLIEAAAGPRAEVRWPGVPGSLEVPGHYAALALDEDGEPRNELVGSLGAGEGFDASLELLGESFELPRVETVSVEEVTSLELVGVYEDPGDAAELRQWGPPIGVLAIARDADGRRLVGAPVRWSLPRGRLALDDSGGDDTLILQDSCRPAPRAPEARLATVAASLDELEATVELHWTAVTDDLDDDEFDPDSPDCVGTRCDCSTAADPKGSLAALLALFVGLGLRRRRRAQAAGGSRSS